MIYNIPYNENFIEVLSDKTSDSLIILPGKYLTDVFKSRTPNAMSYDDLWFKILPSRASHIAESVIIDRAIKGDYGIKSQLRKAINEFFYYGLNVSDLICMNSQHDLLQQTVIDLYNFLSENNLSLRASALQDILNSQLNFNFNKPVYAVLPVIFSPLLLRILKVFREKFNFNLVMHGYDESTDYNIGPDHPQFFMREFLKVIQPENVLNLRSETNSLDNLNDNNSAYSSPDNLDRDMQLYKIQSKDCSNLGMYSHQLYAKLELDQQSETIPQTIDEENFLGKIIPKTFIDNNKDTISTYPQFHQKFHSHEINTALSQLMYPATLLHRLHKEKLYKFNHIEKFSAKSVADEFRSILSVVEDSQAKNISIVSKNTEKLKLLYNYLKEKLKISARSYRIKTSTPTYCYDYLELRLFFKILDVIGIQEINLTDIFELLKQSKYNQEAILLAEKALLEIEELDHKDIKYAEKILKKHEMHYVLELIKKIVSYRDIAKVEYDLPLQIELSDSKFDKLLKGHISAYITIIGCAIDEQLLQILVEIRSCISTWDISLQEYKSIMLELGMRAIISPNESFITDVSDNYISLELLTSIERRFLSYDLTIICDLKEGIWPATVEDHFFISEQTRHRKGYTRPTNYEVGYSAHDFISILASSKKVIISELHEAEIFSQDLLKRATRSSRFLSILDVYGEIADTAIPIYHINQLRNDNLELYSKAAMDIPIEHRPQSISATSLEKLMKNPYLYSLEYNIHLKYLSKFFNKKDNIPSNRDFGIILHKILNKVSQEINYKKNYDSFCEIFQRITQSLVVQKYGDKRDYIMTFWQEKFNNIMNFIYNYNQELYNKHNYNVHTETEKSIAVNIKIADRNIKLHAYVDRLDYTQELLYISDYKTGQLPSKQDIATGKKPQLNLEALLISLLENNIDLLNDDLDKLKMKDTILRYIRLTGIKETNEIKDIDFDLKTTVQGISEILRQLYLEGVSYKATDQYDNYLQAHIMRILNIEHKF